MEITYQVSVDGMPVRFGFGYETASAATAWKSYAIWADNPHMEQRPGRNAGILRNGKYTVELMGRGHHAH